MDASRFDALAKALSATDSRRRLLAFFAAVPIVGSRVSSPDGGEAKPRKHHPHRRHDAHPDLAADKKKRKKKKKPQPPTCTPKSVALTCAGTCGSVTNNCSQVVDCGSCACDPTCDACFTCQDHGSNARGSCVVDPAQQGQSCGSDGKVCQPLSGACACVPACSGKACGPDGCGGSCGPCGGSEVCTAAGACCTPTTCAVLYQEMCPYPGDCDYGICGSFPDGCGGTLDCGSCRHSCFACQNNICVRRPGSEVCGPDTCCINQCCASANQGVCGVQSRCAGGTGTCCPLGFSCCDARDGSNRSSCYNINTYCQGQGLFCCAAGNTCCTNEPCCTSDADCKEGRRCIANGAPSTRGCCSFNF